MNGVVGLKHVYIGSKMKKMRPLLKDRLIAQHIPTTYWFNAENLAKMSKRYSTLYLKPDGGSQGRGIIRLRRLGHARFQLSSWNRSKTIYTSSRTLYADVKKRLIPRTRYIIQQGISLATYRKRPFDIRVGLQKPLHTWRLTWMSAKIASRSNSVVTNIAQGAIDEKIDSTLRGIDQPINIPKVKKQLELLSYRIARILGKRFPFQILGLDMGIDRNGKVWFIEANTLPSFHGLRKVDPVQYRRYLHAKRLIEANNRKFKK